MRKFNLVNEHAKLCGVCGGLAYMLEMPAWVVRLALVLSIVCLGIGIIPYILVAIFAPKWQTDPLDYSEVCDDHLKA